MSTTISRSSSVTVNLRARPERPPPRRRQTLLTAGPWLSLALLCCCLAPLAHAQRTPPRIGFVYPAGGQQGTTFTVFVGGQNLGGATAASFSGPGISAKVVAHERPLTQMELNNLREKQQALQDKRAAARADSTKPAFTAEDEKLVGEIRQTLATRGNRQATPAVAETVTLEVTVAAGATPGRRELRIKAPNGRSNPLVFLVGSLPESTDPVVKATSARPAERPRGPDTRSNRSARMTPREITLPATVNGQILPGEVDQFRFKASKGQRLTVSVAARELIPYLADAVPGWFQATVALYDAHGRELAYSDDFKFRPDPVLLWEAPADGDYVIAIKDAIYRGREDFVYRIVLGELPFVTGLYPLGGRGGQPLTFEVTGWNLPMREVTIDATDRPRGVYEVTLRAGSALANSVAFAVDDRTAISGQEPNDAMGSAQAVTVPSVVDGRIGQAGDVDVYGFEAVAGSFVAEVIARRLGSPLDSTLELLDAQGRRLAANDDFEDKGAGPITHHSDSRIDFTLPADGKYFVRVTDNQRRGGQDFGYRLRLGPPRPDFALRVAPSTINMRAGSSSPITVHALRRDGFKGDILLGLAEAPPGFALSGGRIPASQDSVQLTLTAPSAPREEAFDLKLAGVAMIDGKRIARAAVPADSLMQAFAYHHLVPADQWKVDVTGRGAALRSLTRGPVKIPAGGIARVKVAAPGARLNELRFTLLDAPEGLTVKECVPGLNAVDVVIVCDATKLKAGAGLEGNLILQTATERRPGDGKAAKMQRTLLGLVPAIPFEIVAAPAAIASAK